MITNNASELLALVRLLENLGKMLKGKQVEKIIVFGDSELTIRFLQGTARARK